MSVSRFSLVMIYELSFDWISLSVIASVLLFLSFRCYSLSFVFACSIFLFIFDNVLIILLYVYSYYLLIGSSTGSAG